MSGRRWDITAAARGLSRRAAAAIVAGCPGDLGYGTDAAWLLFLQRASGFDLGYLACEGLEFESTDRFAEQVAAAGGAEAWKARLDEDPGQWAYRVDGARQQVTAMLLSTRKPPGDHRSPGRNATS